MLVVLCTLVMIGLLVYHSLPSIKKFGFSFLYESDWDTIKMHFGALNIILGTIISAFLAIIIATPISIGIAFFVNDILPKKTGFVFSRVIELMAGIPSIIYGLWGFFILVPFLKVYVNPYLLLVAKYVPFLHYLAQEPAFGVSYLAAGIVLALMIIPLMSSIMRDILSEVPFVLKEAIHSFSSTKYESFVKIILPYTKGGILGSIILGLGRALGETMAVTFVIGNAHNHFHGLLSPGTTISSTIANEFGEAIGEIYRSSIIELGLILFLISFVILILSKIFVLHKSVRGGTQ